ncbi:MAG: hypothetical protein ACI4U3_07590 [Traorella sp.]
MKKLVCIFLSLFTLMACSSSDALKFKKEYESLNGKENDKGRDYVEISIPKENPMVYADIDTILEVLDSNGVIYFGFAECPWCRNALPVLIEAAKEANVDTIYYYDIQDIRDTLELDDDGNIVTVKEKSADYQKIYDAMYDALNVYDGINDPTIKRLYAPTVVFVKYGKVVGLHESTLDSQVDPSVPLSDSQKQELKEIYLQGMKAVQASVCDSKC